MLNEQTLIKVYVQNSSNAHWTRYFLGRPSQSLVIQTMNCDKITSLQELVADYWKDGERHVECRYAGMQVGMITVEESGTAVEVPE